MSSYYLHSIPTFCFLLSHILLPPAVISELADPEAPDAVRLWVAALPSWCTRRSPSSSLSDASLSHLGAGEREAIVLGQEVQADFLVIDEEDGRRAARARNLVITGTLGVLERAAEHGLIDLPSTLSRLLTTSFRVHNTLIQAMLSRDAARKRSM